MTDDKFNFTETLQDLDAGVFAAKISQAVRDVAMGVVAHDKAGKVVIELNMKRIGESSQIMLEHTLKYTKPTMKGKVTEDNTTGTALYVGRGGTVSIMPDTQEMLQFEKGEKK